MRLTSSLPLLLAGFAACGTPSAASAQYASVQYHVEAPAFAVRNLDGKVIRSSEFKGRPLVLDFWATWCGPCRVSMPHLDALHERYRSQGLVVLGLSVDDAAAPTVKRFTQRLGVRFPVAIANERMLDEYGPIRAIPTTFFINREGRVVRRVVGYLDPETMEAYVRELF